jgi:phage terminase large subunit-like protein
MARSRGKSRAERNIRWIEKHCRVPEGKDVGKRVRLRPWQKRELRKIYDNPAGTRMAIISFAKKNGKTSFAAFLLLLHLCGPEHRPNTQLPSTAQSKDQAAILFNLAAKVVRLSPTLSPVITIRDTIKQLACEELGTVYKALSAEVATAHGQSPVFAVHDELGQVQGPVSQLFNAIENAMGAHESPMSVVISTQAPNDGDLLSILIDDALKGHDPRVVLSLYTADPELDPFSEEAIKQANPAYGDFLNAVEVRDQAAKARRMPSQEPLYRNYTLNQRVEMSSPFVSRSVWMGCAGEVLGDFRGRPVYGALDLSETTDLTSLVLVALDELEVDQVEGDEVAREIVFHVKPTFWLPGEGLLERARADRVPYDVWAKAGLIELSPGRSVEYQWVAEYLRGVFDACDVVAMAFDRWNWKHLRPWLLEAGFTEEQVTPGGEGAKFVEFGQGFQSMSPALRETESAILNGRLVHGNHPVLNMCMANAVVQRDPAGNRKLNKAKSRGRIDGAVSLAMAISVASTYKPARAPGFQMFFVG